MNRFWKFSPWITRFILMFPALLFASIGIRDLSNIITVMGGRGVAFTSGNGVTVARVGFGAFPLGCGLFLLGCLFFERYLLAAFSFVATLDLVVLVVRIAGMFADSSVPENMPLVRAEVLLLVLTGTGILIELFRRRRVVSAQLAPATARK
jgi:hypothetical protein